MLVAITLAITIKGEPFTVEMRTSREPTCILRGGEKEWSFAPKRLNPWQLRAADVDGNGKMDFLIGVYKRTHIIPHPHKTLFIYEFTGEEVKPKWRASQMGRPLLDFAPAHLKEGRRVVTIERELDGRETVALWKWRGFGLTKVADLGTGKKAVLAELPWEKESIVAKIDGETLKWSR